MSEFANTLIVDSTLQSSQYPYYRTIKEAADYLNGTYADPDVPPVPGTIIVESGTYIIDGTTDEGDKGTVAISSNVTIIGRGNTVIRLERPLISAFRNIDHENGNENITISGFKIVLNMPTAEQDGGEYGFLAGEDPEDDQFSHVIHLKNVKNCRIEKVTITCDPESNFGVYPGNYADADYPDRFPASAIRVEGDEPGDCTDNVITQCYIEEFGKSDTTYDYPESNRYGIGILVLRGNRNRILYNFVRRAKMCCVVGPGAHDYFTSAWAA